MALSGGTVMGMVVAGLSVCGLTTLFFAYTVLFGDATMRELHRAMNVLAGFSLGASSIALFARVGGGIYAEAAGTGAGVVGTVEAGIPEGDPRNPAVIAEMVGDNVGGVAGMGADLFESYVGSIVGAMVLGVAYDSVNLVILPLLLAGLGIAVSIAGTRAVRAEEGGNPQRALNRGSVAAGVLMLVLTYPLVKWLVPRAVTPVENVTGTLHVVSAGGIALATMSGLLAGIAVGVAIAHYTTEARQRQGAGQSLTGAATTVLGDLGLGLLATAWPVIFLAAARSCSPSTSPGSTASPWPAWACSRPSASSWPSTPTGRSPAPPPTSPR